MFRNMLFAAAFAVASVSAHAQELVRFTKGPGASWQVGDKSRPYMTEDGKLAIQMIVKKSPNNGQSYYVVGFTSRTGSPVDFGARVTDEEPSKTHFSGRAVPGKVYTWGEHLPANLNTVWVLYRPSRN
jgi:hypothetical protein